MRIRRPGVEDRPAEDLFRSRLENQIDLRHPLAQLAGKMPWSALEQALGASLPADPVCGGRPALPIRLMAGLIYLKHAYDLSDEGVCTLAGESVLAVLYRRGVLPDPATVRSQFVDALAPTSG